MVLRIAPDMLIDGKYSCFTIQGARREIIRQQRFKDKYPWRHKYRDKIKCIPNSEIINNDLTNRHLEAIDLMIDNGTINDKGKRLFDSSPVDRKFAACALGFGFKISTGDGDLKDFVAQEFPKVFKGSISPLAIINMWIRNGLVNWSDKLHGYVADWNRTGEDPQPKHQKSVYRKLTGLKYPGS